MNESVFAPSFSTTGFGTYSSIYIAIGLALQLGLDREHMTKPVIEKEGANTDSFIDY